MKFSDDYSRVVDKLSYISDRELETLKYGEIYERLANIKYKYSDYELCRGQLGFTFRRKMPTTKPKNIIGAGR